MNSSLKYNNLIKMYFKPFFKEYGFSLQGNTFIIKENSNYGLINFQKSRKSKNDIVIFTINIGVISNRLIDYFSLNIESPSIEDCHWRQRIGFLLKKNNDKWWQIDQGTNVDELYIEIKEYLTSYAISAIKENMHDENLVNLWLSGKSPGLTDIQRLLNLSALVKKMGTYDTRLLAEIITELHQASINKPFLKMVEVHVNKLKNEE